MRSQSAKKARFCTRCFVSILELPRSMGTCATTLVRVRRCLGGGRLIQRLGPKREGSRNCFSAGQEAEKLRTSKCCSVCPRKRKRRDGPPHRPPLRSTFQLAFAALH